MAMRDEVATNIGRKWLSQTLRQGSCTLGPGESCLRSSSAPDLGFEYLDVGIRLYGKGGFLPSQANFVPWGDNRPSLNI